MVGGGKSRDFMVVKGWAYRDPESFARLIETVQEAVAAHLIAQLDAGAEAVQIFDSWAGALPESEFQRWSVEPVAKIVAAVKAVHPAAPVIGYPRGAGVAYERFAKTTGVDAVSIDSTVAPPGQRRNCNSDARYRATSIPRLWSWAALRCAVPRSVILDALGHGPFVFNLGEGVVPQTPPEHVAALSELVRGWPDGNGQ
ncbi:Uroporphyrinogen decarboxylase [Geodia barretti]|nr:Uroporphyrinogen decarboxylase [Geodia barretti]